MALFDSLGFSWNRGSVPRELPRASVERVTFQFARMLPEYVWDAGVLEGNPFTFPEVKTLLDGVTVGGRKLSDQEQILNFARSSKYLLDLVRRREFELDEKTFRALHVPPAEPDAEKLSVIFAQGNAALRENVPNPFERATAFFLFDSLHQFFFDRSTWASRLMMSGALMMEGIDAISVPAMRADEFDSKMTEFRATRDATRMMGFIVECHHEYSRIRQLNPELPLPRDVPAVKHYRFDDPLPRVAT